MVQRGPITQCPGLHSAGGLLPRQTRRTLRRASPETGCGPAQAKRKKHTTSAAYAATNQRGNCCLTLTGFCAISVETKQDGPLTLEIINLGVSPILLSAGMPIAQLIVEEVQGLPAAKNPSQFQGQTTPEGVAMGNGHSSY